MHFVGCALLIDEGTEQIAFTLPFKDYNIDRIDADETRGVVCRDNTFELPLGYATRIPSCQHVAVESRILFLSALALIDLQGMAATRSQPRWKRPTSKVCITSNFETIEVK